MTGGSANATTGNTLWYQTGNRSSSGTYQFGSRTYDPSTASFTTPDTYRTGTPAQDLSVGVDPLTANTYTYVNGNPVNLSDPNGHRAIDAEGNELAPCVSNPNGPGCTPQVRAQAQASYSARLYNQAAAVSAPAAPALPPPPPPPPSDCPLPGWMCSAASGVGNAVQNVGNAFQNTGQWIQQNSQTLEHMSLDVGQFALGQIGQDLGTAGVVACSAGEVITLGGATVAAAPCVAGSSALAVGGLAMSVDAGTKFGRDAGGLHSVEHEPESTPASSESSPARGTSHEPESGSQVGKGSERGLGQSSAGPTGTSSEEPGPAASHSSGISVFRTPRSGNGQGELAIGINPANHETDVFGQAPGHAYVGSEDVAGSFVGVQGYEDFSIEYQMAPEFEQEFAPFRRDYDGDQSQFEYQIPHSSIGRFNELTVARVRSLQ